MEKKYTPDQIEFIEDAPRDGMWYHILEPSTPDECVAQLVKWDIEHGLWLSLFLNGDNDDAYGYLLYEDGSRWSDTIEM